MLSVHPSHTNCQLLPVLLCFLRILFGSGLLNICTLDYFFFSTLKIIFCCLEFRGSDNDLHNGTRSALKFLESGTIPSQICDTHLATSHSCCSCSPWKLTFRLCQAPCFPRAQLLWINCVVVVLFVLFCFRYVSFAVTPKIYSAMCFLSLPPSSKTERCHTE